MKYSVRFLRITQFLKIDSDSLEEAEDGMSGLELSDSLYLQLLWPWTTCLTILNIIIHLSKWSISQCSPEKQKQYFKELVHLIVGAGTSEIWWIGWQAGNSGRSWCCSFEAEFLLWENLVLLLRPSKWLDEVHAHYYE